MSIIASGMEVYKARGCGYISQGGIEARVVDMFTIKPIDAECVIDCADRTGAIVTAENANIIGGMGSSVAEVLLKTVLFPWTVGVKDEFGEVGEPIT